MKQTAIFWLVLNVLAVLVAAAVLIGVPTPPMRILFVVLLIINSASLPGCIEATKRANGNRRVQFAEAGVAEVIHDKCACGEPVDVEIGLMNVCRRDGKRPHHPGASDDVTQFRCRKCLGWLGDTCPSAAFAHAAPNRQGNGPHGEQD